MQTTTVLSDNAATLTGLAGRVTATIAELRRRGIDIPTESDGEALHREERAAWEAYRNSCAQRTGVPQYFRSAEVEPGKLSEYLLRRTRTGRSSYVCGEAGTWKTYSSCAVINALCDEGRRDVLFTTAQRFEEAREAVKRGDAMALRAIEDAGVLVFDDVDKLDLEYPGGTHLEWLYSLADVRQGKTTIWTSNLTYAQLGLRIVTIKVGHADATVRRISEQCKQEIIAERSSWHLRKIDQS